MSNVTEQDTASHQFDPADEKRKLLLEFENMCDDIAANEDPIGVPVDVEPDELPRANEYSIGEPVDLKPDELPRAESPVEREQEQSEHEPQPQDPERAPSQEQEPLEDAKSKLQWRFQSICQQMSSDVDISLIEQALASIENAISSRQNQNPK